MNPTPLEGNPTLRKKIYTGFWLIGLALGAMAAFFGSAENDAPDWLVPTTAAYAFLGAGVGYTAQQNVRGVNGGQV